jgi:hypothetical protein
MKLDVVEMEEHDLSFLARSPSVVSEATAQET